MFSTPPEEDDGMLHTDPNRRLQLQIRCKTILQMVLFRGVKTNKEKSHKEPQKAHLRWIRR